VACNAKKTVTFEVIEKKAEEGLDAPGDAPAPVDAGTPAAPGDGSAGEGAGPDQEIVAKPTVPSTPPTNIVISPDRLPGT
jgi:hypothetical protein